MGCVWPAGGGNLPRPCSPLHACRCARPLPDRDGIRPTELYPVNAAVDQLNTRELDKIQGHPEVVFRARDSVEPEEREKEWVRERQEEKLWGDKWFRDCLAAEQIKLKVGRRTPRRPLNGGGGGGMMPG